jgi:hypothetical protein
MSYFFFKKRNNVNFFYLLKVFCRNPQLSVNDFYTRSRSREKRLLVSSFPSIRPSVYMQQRGFLWMDFRKNIYNG